MYIDSDIFLHSALYVFYEANKDDYYNTLTNGRTMNCAYSVVVRSIIYSLH